MPEAHELRPATEQVLARLPGSRLVWIGVWALVPWLNAGANLLLGTEGAVWEQSDALVILNYAALSFAVVITLWGTARIARRLEALRVIASALVEGNSREHFRGIDNVTWPLLATAATSVALAAGTLVSDGLTPALLRGATWLVLGVPLWTFLWTYVTLQLGLDRLGRERLLPEVARSDPGLGLRPFGGVAFTGLWILLAWLVPVVLTGLPDVVGVALGAFVLLGGLATFFLSMLRLHRQMVELKANELAIARELYAQAYEPVRASRSLETLEQQHSLLGAADGLEKRAHAIHEWPIDDGIFARVVTIATSVVAITVARLILDPLGL